MTPEQLKTSILLNAIQGKLVEQRDNERSCNIISSYQGETEDFYEIPSNWKWLALKDVVTINTGLAFKKLDQKSSKDGTLRILRGGNIGDDYKYHLYDDDIYVDYVQFQDRYIPLKIGDVITPSVTSMEKMCKTGYIDVELGQTTAGGFVYIIRTIDTSVLDSKYLLYFISSSFNKEQCKPNIHKSGQAFYNLKKSGFIEQPICIPPIEEQHRIVAKIEEILPYIDRYAEAYERLEQFNTKFPEEMKKSILQYAIQGKLVEQRPEEGTAEELYQQIVIDREEKIKAGLYKRDKRSSLSGTEIEKPFDIPDSWKWVTLGSILLKLTDGTHKTPKYAERGIKFVSVKDMSTGQLSLENTKFITKEEHEELYKRCDPKRGDMLLSKVGTTGVPAIVDTDEEFSLFVSVALLKFNPALIDTKYLYYLLYSPLVQQQAADNTRGVGNKNWVLDAIGNTLITLPPYKEQLRIVEELEKLLPYCDKLKK